MKLSLNQLNTDHVAEAKKQLAGLRYSRFVFDENETFECIDDKEDDWCNHMNKFA